MVVLEICLLMFAMWEVANICFENINIYKIVYIEYSRTRKFLDIFKHGLKVNKKFAFVVLMDKLYTIFTFALLIIPGVRWIGLFIFFMALTHSCILIYSEKKYGEMVHDRLFGAFDSACCATIMIVGFLVLRGII